MGNLSTRPATVLYSPDRSKSHFHHGSSTKVETLDKEMWIPVVKKTKKSKGKKKNLKKFMTTTETPKHLTPHHSGMYNALTKTKKTKTAKAIEPEFINKTKNKKIKMRKQLTKTRKLLTKDAKADNKELMTQKKTKTENEFNLTPLTQNLAEMSDNQLFSQILNHLILIQQIKKIREITKKTITVPNKTKKRKKNKNKSTKRLRIDGNDLNNVNARRFPRRTLTRGWRLAGYTFRWTKLLTWSRSETLVR